MYIDSTDIHFKVFLFSVGFGFIVGLLYDFFKVFRTVVLKSKKGIFIQDILFFLFIAVITFLFLLSINGGRFRFYIFVALAVGFAVYFFTFSSFVFGFSLKILEKLKSAFFLLSTIISFPLRKILKPAGKIRKKFKEILIKLSKMIKFKQKPLENENSFGI
ncbi:MAG: spore cortex biosynthesis protein YabQ [Clostridia bacterium]|nr:spore cortex biosynthesis protein YabQ [Clostridia bacterium]